MTRQTIDYGIDLGTTNSSIAVLQDDDTKIIENNEGQKYTPSVVWIDRKDRLYVGRRAKNQIESEPENAYGEFKLQMGTPTTYSFHAGRRTMTPEELSAEIIKSLREDVRQQLGEEIRGAVITVPAAFELPQCKATMQAAQLAGLADSPLLQEPVAAALAYGFQRDAAKAFWLIYDFGGGTFDAAIIHANEGNIQVLNHGGDNHLGGKLVDWAIVDRMFAPLLKQVYALEDFHRGNEKWRMAFAKLKLHAEEAKIQLSRYETTQIYIDPLCQDDRGDWIVFDFELKQKDLDAIMLPYVEKSIDICQQVLTEAKLSAEDIERLILVGGPTLNPRLRQMLEERLGVKADFNVDPMTVVSRGAAIFAGTQRLKAAPVQSIAKDCYRIELDYNPIDSDPEPLAAGKLIVSGDEAVDSWTIELIESKSQWRSGGIRIDENGFFMTNLRAEKGRRNEFLIELKNQCGNKLKTDPDRIIYTLGATITSQPLIRSIGVALANSKVSVFLKKGSDLPIRRREVFQTTQDVKKGESGSFLNIPVVEGENWDRADRNHLIGSLKVNGQTVKRDVCAGSEVEVTITIDESRQAHALAYVPVLDEEFEEVLTLEKASADWETLNQEIYLEKERFAALRETAQKTEHPPALELLEKIERQDLMAEIERTLAAANSDQDALDKAQNQLIDLRKILDEMESLSEWPKLARETQELFDQIEEILKRRQSEMGLPTFRLIRQETEKVLQSRQQSALKQKIEKLKEYYLQLMEGEPTYWVEYYRYLEKRREQFGDSSDADFCFDQGKRALSTNNLRLLESAVRHLAALAPGDSQMELNNLNSTLMPLVR